MKLTWTRRDQDWWWTDLSCTPDQSSLSDRALRGKWQTARYRTRENDKTHSLTFEGVMLLANPAQGAPAVRFPLPPELAGKRCSIRLGLTVNYCDRILVKLERGRCFEHLRHSPVAPGAMALEEVWWRDVDVREGDALVVAQDRWMGRRCAFGFLRVTPGAPALTKPECELFATVDGMPGNDGPVDLDQMMANELQFDGTHVSAILHGTDINGAAQYVTALPENRFPLEEVAEEVYPDNEYYQWTVEQFQKFVREGRCPLRDSIRATHDIGRRFYAYHRMAVTRLYAPFRSIFRCPFYDAHPEWLCVDFDGTPVSRLSLAYPQVRRFFLDHFRENMEFGADGLCLVFSRGWPMMLFEEPVAQAFREKTGRDLRDAKPDGPAVRDVWAGIITAFIREIRSTMERAATGRDAKLVVMTLAQPAFNRRFGMDIGEWAREGLVDAVVPYPYNVDATAAPILIPDWVKELSGSRAKLCPIINRMTYEPAGIFETPLGIVDRAEQWLREGVHGFGVWDLDSAGSLPMFRGIASNLCSREGRERFRAAAQHGPTLHELMTLDGITLDRYPPGWNV